MNLRIDLETYSSVDLPKCGVAKYVASDDFEILLFAYCYDDGPIEVVDLAQGEAIPESVLSDLVDPKVTKSAFNAPFEIACLNAHFAKKAKSSE
jgi:DNA polymerase